MPEEHGNPLVEFIKRYARDHYEDGGWDVVVECFGKEEILETLDGAKTEAEALKAFGPLVEVWAERQADARITAAEFEDPMVPCQLCGTACYPVLLEQGNETMWVCGYCKNGVEKAVSEERALQGFWTAVDGVDEDSWEDCV